MVSFTVTRVVGNGYNVVRLKLTGTNWNGIHRNDMERIVKNLAKFYNQLRNFLSI